MKSYTYLTCGRVQRRMIKCKIWIDSSERENIKCECNEEYLMSSIMIYIT